jgi:hypothetical protein
MSFILYSRLNEQNADAVIQQQIDYFTRRKLPFVWKVYDHDSPADLKDRLAARGFEVEDPDAVMVLDLQTAPPALLAPVTVDVRRLTDPAQLADVIAVEEAVWGSNFDWIHARMGHHLTIPGYLSIYVAYVEGRPACAGWTYYHPNSSRFASLWGGSTLPTMRRQGLYSAVLAARVQEAIQRGRQYLLIDAGPMSRPIVTRHGFRLLTYAHERGWKDNPPPP